MKKYISTLLIIVGIAVMAYPLGERAYSWYWQQKMFEEWERESSEYAPENTSAEDFLALENLFLEGPPEYDDDPGVPDIEDPDNEETGEQVTQPTTPTPKPEPPKINSIGIIRISKIKLRLPILYGATNNNLKIGAAQIKGTAPIGKIGNTAISAHRAHNYGRLFNRLDELEIGDEVVIETPKGTFTYTVYKKHIVEPTDTSVLNRNNRDRVLTLITCDPMINPTHRLIVHAVIRE